MHSQTVFQTYVSLVPTTACARSICGYESLETAETMAVGIPILAAIVLPARAPLQPLATAFPPRPVSPAC